MMPGCADVEKLKARLDLTAEISETINRSLDLDTVLITTLDRLLDHYRIQSGLLMVRSRTGSLRVGCHRGLGSAIPSAPHSYSEFIATSGPMLVDARISQPPPSLSGDQCLSAFASVISVPIWSAADIVGVLHLCADDDSLFGDDDKVFLESLGHVVGAAVTNARLYKALTDELRSSRLTNEISRQITEGSLEIGQLLSRAAESLKKHFGLVHCSFFLIDALRSHLVAMDMSDYSDTAGNINGLRIQMRSEPIMSNVLRERKAVTSDNVHSAIRIMTLLGLSDATIAVVPLVTNGRIIGVVIAGRATAGDGQTFSKADLERMETVAAYIAGALENSRLYQESLDLNTDLIELDAVTQLAPSVEAPEATVHQLLEKAVFGTKSEAGAVYQDQTAERAFLEHVASEVSSEDKMLRDMRMASAARVAASENRAVELRLPAPHNGSLLAVPLHSITGAPGAMVLFKRDALEERDRRLTSVVADRAASILDNARLFEATRRHLNELTHRNEELITLNRKNIELTEKLSLQLEARRREAQLAADIQKSLLEDTIPQGQDLDIAVAYLPLEEASGDYYDVFRLDESRMGIVITDAVGHGVPAAFVGGFSKMLLDVYKPRLAEGETPAQVLSSINRHLCSYGHNQLMTMFLGIYDGENRQLAYANGGHPLPLLFKTDGQILALEAPSHIMGAWVWDYEDRYVQLDSGDRLLFYTDGLVEAQDTTGERLGKRVILDWFAEHKDLTPVELNNGMYGILSDFTCGRIDHDDVTILTMAVLEQTPITGSRSFSSNEDLVDAWHQIKDGLNRFAYDTRAQYGVRLALEESMTNAIRYGCVHGGCATLEHYIDGRECRVKVIDEGPGFDPNALPDPTSPEKLIAFGGRGVFMIRKSVDLATWNDKGNEVTLVKRKSRSVDILVTQNVEVNKIMAEELKVSFEAVNNATVLVVSGPVDAVSAPVLSESIDDLLTKKGAMVVDLGGVSFLGSAAVSILVKAFSSAKERGVKLALVKPSDRDVSEMLDILGLLSVFPVAATRDEAVQLAG